MLTQKQSETADTDKTWESLKGSGLRKYKGGMWFNFLSFLLAFKILKIFVSFFMCILGCKIVVNHF